jgi:hypothetical protein
VVGTLGVAGIYSRMTHIRGRCRVDGDKGERIGDNDTTHTDGLVVHGWATKCTAAVRSSNVRAGHAAANVVFPLG